MKKINPIILLFVVVLPALGFPRMESEHVTLDYVAKKAGQRARKPFRSPKADLPDVLRKLDYDKYRNIEFRHDKAFWSEENLPFRVEFFHPGYLYQEPVHINEFTLTHVQPVRFVQDFFDYRNSAPMTIPANTGYAGFRLQYQLNSPGKWDELGAFLGASYFRVLGKDQSYGLSARGLAVDCGETDRPEEFPIFTDWWLGKPQRDDDALRLYAILDSVRCTGAYEFLIRPGESTVVEVEAVLYFREESMVRAVDPQHKPLNTFGMAPLTSMFWIGESSQRKFDDYRPEVHDSDGLLMHMENNEILWRPLDNPPAMTHQSFEAKNIRGFGLLQRNRNFSSYQDLFNTYNRVPSVWVEPHGSWGDGQLHLVELSTQYEGLDNIVAFWNPKTKPQPMQPYQFGYTMYWTHETDLVLSSNKVVSTRVGIDPRDASRREFVIDFAGPKLDGISAEEPPQASASCSENGTVTESQVFRNLPEKTWRVVLKMEPKAGNHDPIDLRCALKKGEEVLSETWTYHWSPP